MRLWRVLSKLLFKMMCCSSTSVTGSEGVCECPQGSSNASDFFVCNWRQPFSKTVRYHLVEEVPGPSTLPVYQHCSWCCFWRRFLNSNWIEHSCCKQTHHVKVLLIYWPLLLPHDRVFKSFLPQWCVFANHFNYLCSCWCREKDTRWTRLGINKAATCSWLFILFVCIYNSAFKALNFYW